MKIKSTYLNALFGLSVLALASCATPAKAPIAANSDPQAEIGRVSAAIEDASAKQYDRLAPKNFARAVDYRNSAAEKLSKGKGSESILSDVAVSLQAIQQVKNVGDTNQGLMRGALEARRYAVMAQGPKFSESKFRSADDDLADIGKDLEKGNSIDSDDLKSVEKKFGEAEIAARKHGELGNVRLQIKQAKSNGAKGKTPSLYEIAVSRADSAEHAIELSPHTADGYAHAVSEAQQSARKLTEVLTIARKNKASETVALTIWNQNQALEASRSALSKTKADAANKLQQTKAEADAELAKAQAEAMAEQEKLASDLEAKNARIASQGGAIAALRSENSDYASTEELKQKIEEVKKTFAPDEAEVMKDGTKIVVRLKKMQFSSGRSDLNPDSFATLRKVDNLIAAVPAKQITVEGHTDSVGSNATNKALSEKRAESVKKYLVSQGLSEELRVDTEGYGSDRPLTTNKTKEGRATNRRVDIVIDTPVVL
ncbi:MAG: OmpA family protein [Bacteriovoracia bacterium]